ncbi:MAG: FMN-binding protein [Spirochaetia bacterium]|nr:FMN-binding protein [Spirochaetia bacterium]
MKNILSIGFKLALICAVAAISLSLINMITAPKIEAYKEQKLLEALEAVSSNYSIGERTVADNEKIEYLYDLNDEAGNLSGYALRIRATGYGGEMWVLASYNLDGSVITARLLDNTETPGLGKKAEDSSYMSKFEGTGTNGDPIPERKNDLSSAEAEAVSGATVTFTGIAKAIAFGSDFVSNEMEGVGDENE